MALHKIIHDIESGALLPYARKHLKTLQKQLGRYFSVTQVVDGTRITFESFGKEQRIRLQSAGGPLSFAVFTKVGALTELRVYSSKLAGSKWKIQSKIPFNVPIARPTQKIGLARATDFTPVIRAATLINDTYQVFHKKKPNLWFSASDNPTVNSSNVNSLSYTMPVVDGVTEGRAYAMVKVDGTDFNVFRFERGFPTIPVVDKGSLPVITGTPLADFDNFPSRAVHFVGNADPIVPNSASIFIYFIQTNQYAGPGHTGGIIAVIDSFVLTVKFDSYFGQTIMTAPVGAAFTRFLGVVPIGKGRVMALYTSGSDKLLSVIVDATGAFSYNVFSGVSSIGTISNTTHVTAIGEDSAVVGFSLTNRDHYVFVTRDAGVTWSNNLAFKLDVLVTLNSFDGISQDTLSSYTTIKPATATEEAEILAMVYETNVGVVEYRSVDTGVTWVRKRVAVAANLLVPKSEFTVVSNFLAEWSDVVNLDATLAAGTNLDQ